MSNNNYHINDLVCKMLTGEITEEECEALLRRAEADSSLKTKVQSLMEEDDFVSRYRAYRSVDATEAKERFLREIKDRRAGEAPHATSIWKRYIAAAAVVALVVVGGWMALGNREEKAPVVTAEISHAIKRVQDNDMSGATLIVGGKKVPVKDAQTVREREEQMEDGGFSAFGMGEVVEGSLVTKKDKEFWMVLDDGTYVHLNYNTKLVYPNRFVGSERRVKLHGEAYFAVAPDSKKRPFVVETANGDVRDYGTEFNVNTVGEEGTTSVVLVKGKVGVSGKHGKEYLLQPGEMATLQPGRTPRIDKVDVDIYTSWNTGNFFFDGCTLEELMQVISHWYGMKVEYVTDDLREMQFTGSIDKYEPMPPTLNAIEKVTGLGISAKDGVITVRHGK